MRTHLLFKLTNQVHAKKCVDMMKKFEDMSPYPFPLVSIVFLDLIRVVIQNMVSQASNTRNSHPGIAARESFIDMDFVDNSPFIPLSAFLQQLKEDESIDFKYIKENSERSIEQAFSLAVPKPVNFHSSKVGKEEE